MSEIAQPVRAANSSTANFPFTSVAVVITGSAPSTLDSRRASRFAPPMCPERSGITCRARSSRTKTAGSVFLSRTYGAISRRQCRTRRRRSTHPSGKTPARRRMVRSAKSRALPSARAYRAQAPRHAERGSRACRLDSGPAVGKNSRVQSVASRNSVVKAGW